MTTDKRFEEAIGGWLEETAPARVPERVLDATFERTRGSRQRFGWRPGVGQLHLPRPVIALGAAAVVALAAALTLAFLADQPRVGGPATPAPLPATPADWSRVVLESPSGTGSVTSITAGARGLLAVVSEQDGDGPTRLFVSHDGTVWTLVPEDQHPRLWEQRQFGDIPVVGTDRGFLMLLGDEVWESETGDDWQRLASSITDPDLLESRMLAAAVGGPGLVAVGSDDKAWYATDGSDWTPAVVPPPPAELDRPDYPNLTVEFHGIAVAGDRLVAWGYAGADNGVEGIGHDILMASSDGRTWTSVLPQVTSLATVAGGPDGFAAIGVRDAGSGYEVWSSADGQEWRSIGSLAIDARSSDAERDLRAYVRTVAATVGGFVAVGEARTCVDDECPPEEAAIWTSADGRSWSRLPRDVRFISRDPAGTVGTSAGSVVAWGSRFVVGGTVDDRPAIWISGPKEQGSAALANPNPTEASETAAPADAELAGTWGATDPPPDSSHLRMEVVERPDGTFSVTIRDDFASVCRGASSTMVGVATPRKPGTIVIGQPEFTCDDGTQAKALSGTATVEELLLGLSFTYDVRRDGLMDSSGLIWHRVEVTP